MADKTKEDLVYCPKCKDYHTVSIKMFNTIVCNSCNIIISSDKGINKVGR